MKHKAFRGGNNGEFAACLKKFSKHIRWLNIRNIVIGWWQSQQY